VFYREQSSLGRAAATIAARAQGFTTGSKHLDDDDATVGVVDVDAFGLAVRRRKKG